MTRKRGQNRPTLQLRGKNVGQRLAARIQAWQSSGMSKHPEAYHKPGSSKK